MNVVVSRSTRTDGDKMNHSEEMQAHFRRQALETDRTDLIGLLELRFGTLPTEVINTIMQISKLEILERLVLVAANVPTWETFQRELRIGDTGFKITGEDFNPLSDGHSPSTD